MYTTITAHCPHGQELSVLGKSIYLRLQTFLYRNASDQLTGDKNQDRKIEFIIKIYLQR